MKGLIDNEEKEEEEEVLMIRGEHKNEWRDSEMLRKDNALGDLISLVSSPVSGTGER